jgi:hypothetical protein
MFSRESPIRSIVNWMDTTFQIITVVVAFILMCGVFFSAFYFTGTDWPVAIVITIMLIVVIGCGGVGELLLSIFLTLILKLSAGVLTSMLTSLTTIESFTRLGKVLEGIPFPQVALAIFTLVMILKILRDYIVGFRR